MNCGECQEKITLDAVTAEVERHLESCAECREFRASLHNVLGLLEDAHQQIGESQLAPVRERVRGRISAGRRRWVPAWAGGIAAAVILLTIWVARHESPASKNPPPIASVAPVYPGPLPDPRGSEQSTPKPNRTTRVRKPAPKPPAEPLTVKLITDDPNVVIYWIIDGKEE
jgi:hypothetical protein